MLDAKKSRYQIGAFAVFVQKSIVKSRTPFVHKKRHEGSVCAANHLRLMAITASRTQPKRLHSKKGTITRARLRDAVHTAGSHRLAVLGAMNAKMQKPP